MYVFGLYGIRNDEARSMFHLANVMAADFRGASEMIGGTLEPLPDRPSEWKRYLSGLAALTGLSQRFPSSVKARRFLAGDRTADIILATLSHVDGHPSDHVALQTETHHRLGTASCLIITCIRTIGGR